MMRIVFYHVGKGDMSLVLFPSGQAMMVDCNKAEQAAQGELTDEDGLINLVKSEILDHRDAVGKTIPLVKEAAVSERQGKKKIPIALLAITHADSDHITKHKALQEHFEIEKLMDSGREYKDPSAATKDYLDFRKTMVSAGKYIRCERARPIKWAGIDAEIIALAPNRAVLPEENNNNQCLVLKVTYAGTSFLFAGDSPLDDWTNEENGILVLHGADVEADILNASHHGSRSFFTPEGPPEEGQQEWIEEQYDTRALTAIRPGMSFITCSDNEDAEHPNPIALEIYKKLTNPGIASSGKNHVVLSRDSQHLTYVVCSDGCLYLRTSRSCMSNSDAEGTDKPVYLVGSVKGGQGYLHTSGIWVVREPLANSPSLKFTVKEKGSWDRPVCFDWWVLNNGQEKDRLHREFYTIEGKERKGQSAWDRQLQYAGVHLMQCHASSADGKQWANWCVPVCHESSLNHALRWLEIFPGCVDPTRINCGW